MKKHLSLLITLSLVIFIAACSNNSTTSSTSDTSKTTMSTESNNNTQSNTTTPTTTTTSAPLAKEDSEFVMKAAIGGMEEVEGGKVAQQNAQSQRVKDFGSMMVNDHSKAGDELKSLAASKGITLPASLPADKMKHIDAMKKLNGKAFDTHYMSMMVNDHKTDIGEFEKASKNVKDNDLKNWVTKTLPTLKTHLDSAQAINKSH